MSPRFTLDGDLDRLGEMLETALRTAGYPTEIDFHIRAKNKHGEETTIVLRIEF